VRLPAHFCGVVGFKPSYGRVPYFPVPNNSSLSHIGPIARDVGDATLMLEVMSGPHPSDVTSLPRPFRADPSPASLKGLRVAYSATLGHAHVDPAVAALVAKAVRAFSELGANVEAIDPPWGPEGHAIIEPLWLAAQRALRPADPAQLALVDPALAACIEDAMRLTADDLIAAQGKRLNYAAKVGNWFAEGFDLLLTPAASVTAFEIGRVRPAHWPAHPWNWIVWAEFSYPFNLAHAPAISVPCGVTDDGLPVGLQIAGPRHADKKVLRAAAGFLAARPFDRAPPLPG
jgi:aspartyl-tRNA(Asn)/glutamyl-tRNA(Gln) amidotransferase subunit A